MTDRNVELIQKAIETKTEITLIPRRSHTVKGVPLELVLSTLRVYVDTGESVESVLLSEVGHFSFPKKLYDTNSVPPIKNERPESFRDYVKRKRKEEAKAEV